ncbi:MAG: hypothetical protein WDM76_16485 [Limisphaerales bacterium]
MNWDANDDGNNGFIRTQPDGGVVMAEMTGPGCIWRIWSAQVGTGHVKIFLDGSTNATVDLAFQDYFNRTSPPFNYPSLNYMASGGFNSYCRFPTTFPARSSPMVPGGGISISIIPPSRPAIQFRPLPPI